MDKMRLAHATNGATHGIHRFKESFTKYLDMGFHGLPSTKKMVNGTWSCMRFLLHGVISSSGRGCTSGCSGSRSRKSPSSGSFNFEGQAVVSLCESFQ